ncbi:hypothetical protein CL634_10885 [bacterium]|nr:hypothetical protein [bacterium]
MAHWKTSAEQAQLKNAHARVGGNDTEQILQDDGTNALGRKTGANLRIYFQHIPSGRTVSFKSLITEFSDQFTSDWNSETVYGRMDPIETFQGTRRTISLAWDVVSYSLEDAKKNLRHADELINMLYPTYESVKGGAGTIASSPLLRLKFANLIRQPGSLGRSANITKGGLVGRVGGFVYTPNLNEGIFTEGPNNMKLYAQTINLSCEFTVFHTHKLGWRFKEGSRKLSVQKGFPHGATKGGELQHREPPPVRPATAQQAAAQTSILMIPGGEEGFVGVKFDPVTGLDTPIFED